jgi:hypothetical protein
MGKSGRIPCLPVAYLAPGLVSSLGNSIIRAWPYALDVAKGWIRPCFGVSYSESILFRINSVKSTCIYIETEFGVP